MTAAPVTNPVRVGTYALEVGADSGSFAQFESKLEEENAQALTAALADRQEERTLVATVEQLDESTTAVTNKIERAHGLFRAAVEGRLLDRDVLMGEVDELLGLSKRLDRAERFEEELRLARALHGLLAVTFRWLDLIRSLRRALRSAKKAGDRAGEAWALHELGSLHLCAGDAETAEQRFREAFQIQEQLGAGGWCATRHNLDCARRDLAGGRPPTPRRPPRGRLGRLLAGRHAKGVAVLSLLVLAVGSGGTAAGVALTGHDRALQPTLDREALPFSASPVGATSAPQSISLQAGSETIAVGRIAAGNPDVFLIGDSCGSRLAAGTSCAIQVRFRPKAPGRWTTVLSIDLGQAGQLSAELVGTGIAPLGATLAPSPVEFGDVEQGATLRPKTLTLSAGSKKLTILEIASDSGEFRAASHCPPTLAAGATCAIEVVFAPAASGTRTGKLTVTPKGGPKLTSELRGSGLKAVRPDLPPPTVTITDGPSSPTRSTQASLSFQASEADVSFQCGLDGGALTACTSPKVYSGLSDSRHTFSVQATDAAGNSGKPASYGWVVDAVTAQPMDITPPTVTITGPADPTKSTQASLSFHANEADVSFQCRLDGQAFSACTSPKTFSDLSAGEHAFAVQATDAAGNAGPAATYGWTVDTSPPTVTITGPADPTKSTQASLSFRASEADVSFQCGLDGGAFTACTSPKVYSRLSDGRHTFSVQATDAAGNAGPATTYSWTVQPPDIYLR
jgi:Tetratricopeptide repeat